MKSLDGGRLNDLAESLADGSGWSPCSDPTLDHPGDGDSPIYGKNGNLLGTDDQGLQGKAIVMNEDNFKQNMSHDEAVKNSLGMEGLENDRAKSNFAKSYNSLKNRPDYDGEITLSEANNWYRNGNGKPLFCDLKKIDMSGISSDRFEGSREAFNLLLNSNDMQAGLVLGSITLKLYSNNVVKAYQDNYDFDSHNKLNPLNWPRNFATYIGNIYAGGGKSFPINFYGSQTVKPTFLPNK